MRINCKIHAKEMRLLGLRRRLTQPDLEGPEREAILREITKLEQELGLEESRSQPQIKSWRSGS